MKSNSRTAKSIKNSVVAMSFYIVNLALQFFSRKVFLDYLGTEILGTLWSTRKYSNPQSSPGIVACGGV